MADYKKIGIDVMENGYTVSVINKNGRKGKRFVFEKGKNLRDWLKENLSATGQAEEFIKALD